MTTRACRLLTLLATCGVLAACGPSPAPTPGSGKPATPATGAPAAPAAAGAYDPEHDPLSNPASLFEPPPADPKAVAEDETVYRNMDGNPKSLNPIFATSQYEQYMNDLMFSAPFTFDSKLNFMVDPDMVASFEEKPDHVTFVTKLKPGLTWQDGAPFTSDDVCFTFDVIMDPRVPALATRTGPDQVKSCTANDPLTFTMVAKEPLPTNKWNIGFNVIPKHVYAKDRAAHPDLNGGDTYDKANRLPVGNGPYKIVSWDENDKIVLERWDGYTGRKPFFKRVVMRIIPDANVLLLSFNKGDVDEFRMTALQFATQTGPDSDFAKAGGVKCRVPQWDYTYIGWNMDGSNPFFGDVRVRKAMTMACDMERMRKDLAYDLYDRSHGIFHPDSWMYPKDGIPLLPYDLDQAGKLLDDAGWKVDEQHEGWRAKLVDGKPVTFAFTLLIPQGSALGQKIGAMLQENLKSLGVKMDMQVIEWASYSERTRKHQFEACTAAWGPGVDPDQAWNIWVSTEYDKEGNSGRNYGGYKNAEVDALFNQGRHEFDPAKRAEIYGRIAKLVYDDQPYTFLFTRPVLWGIQSRIHGVGGSPRGIFLFTPGFQDWWVHAGEAKHPVASAS